VTAAITLTERGAQITGVPLLEDWAASFTQALDNSAASTWQRIDLIAFADDESPYGDDVYQYVSEARLSLGTWYNNRRLGKRFPYGHDLRRFDRELSASHFEAVAPLSDTDAEIVLTEAATDGLGREYVRARVKEIKNQPDPRKAALTLTVSDDGVVTATERPPTWAWNNQYEIVIKERIAV
jgi:hypothetical protein